MALTRSAGLMVVLPAIRERGSVRDFHTCVPDGLSDSEETEARAAA